MSSRRAARPKSTPVTTTRKTNTMTRTTPVVFKTVGNVGHVTRFNSEKTSLIFAPTRRNQFGFLFFVFFVFTSPRKILPLTDSRHAPAYRLFGFFMFGVLLAERAILFENQSVGIVLLVLDAVIVSMLAFRAFECNFGPCRLCCHIANSIQKNYTPLRCVNKVYHTCGGLVNPF